MRSHCLLLILGLFLVVTGFSALASGPTGDPALDAVWGKDITVRELPGGAPPGASDKMLNTKVTWSTERVTTTVSRYVGAGTATETASTHSQGGSKTGAGLRLPLATVAFGLGTLIVAVRSPLRRTSNPV